jgi:hypothetical protein
VTIDSVGVTVCSITAAASISGVYGIFSITAPPR